MLGRPKFLATFTSSHQQFNSSLFFHKINMYMFCIHSYFNSRCRLLKPQANTRQHRKASMSRFKPSQLSCNFTVVTKLQPNCEGLKLPVYYFSVLSGKLEALISDNVIRRTPHHRNAISPQRHPQSSLGVSRW